MEKNNYEEVVLNLYNKYSKKIVDSLINKGILFEFDYGFGSTVIENGYTILQTLLNNDSYDVELNIGCFYYKENPGENLYYIFNNEIYDYNSARKIAKERFDKNNLIK